MSAVVVVVSGGSSAPLPVLGWGRPGAERGCHALGETQTRSHLQLPGAECLLWAQPVLRLRAFNPGICFETPIPPRTCSCYSDFTDGKSEAQEM